MKKETKKILKKIESICNQDSLTDGEKVKLIKEVFENLKYESLKDEIKRNAIHFKNLPRELKIHFLFRK